jgi:hypothetical protein
MKKQLLIAAVAATMGTAVIADVSITGNAKFEYFNIDNAGVETNQTGTEVNLGIKGKNGDTAVVLNLEFNTHDEGGTNTTSEIDVEDMYITSKLGDVSIKAGNFASGTSGILGEIDEGGRASNKVHFSTTVGNFGIYAGNSGTDTVSGTASAVIDGNMYVGVSTTIAGYKVEAKKTTATTEGYAISGDVAGVGVRLEHKSNDTANSDVTFGHLTYSVNGIDLGYAFLNVDNTDSLVGETDSAIFAKENGGVASARDNNQISAKTTIQGNTVTVKSGSIDKGVSSTVDKDYTQVAVSRALASGATLAATYTDEDMSATTDKKTFELDLSVKF